MSVDELVESLLYEGYALYPYTPGATKNATPTPFGIVYPPAYAAGSPHTHERVKLQCVAIGAEGFTASVHCLVAGKAHRIDLDGPCETDVVFGPVSAHAWLATPEGRFVRDYADRSAPESRRIPSSMSSGSLQKAQRTSCRPASES